MNGTDSLQLFRQVIWVSGLACAGLVLLLLCLTVWRPLWFRVLTWEENFWKRVGIGAGFLSRLRRIEDSRWLMLTVVLLLVVHFTLLVVSAGAHLYFAPKLKSRGIRPPPLKERHPQRSEMHGGGSPLENLVDLSHIHVGQVIAAKLSVAENGTWLKD